MKVNQERRGAEHAPKLVLIHGIGHRWQAWEPVMARLAEHHDVWAIDLPGFGGSPIPEAGMPVDMPGTVALLREFLAEVGLERPHVAGYSLGGAIALELAAADLVSSATAFSPAGFYTSRERLRALGVLSSMRLTTRMPDRWLRTLLRVGWIRTLAFAPLVVSPRLIDPLHAFGDACALRDCAGFPVVARAARGYEYVGEPSCPVTVGWGDRDRIFRVRQAARARQRLPRARHVILPRCGHVPMSDDPRRVAELILQTTGMLRHDAS